VKSALREKDRYREGTSRDRAQSVVAIYHAFYCRSLYKVRTADGPVAQGIEQQPSKLKVAGSNPAGVATFRFVRPGDTGAGFLREMLKSRLTSLMPSPRMAAI
jgi:hypothetical protein